MKKQICLSAVTGILCLSQSLMAVTVNNPAYQVETYFQYDVGSLGRARDFTFDSDGNIYITHSHDDTARNGSVQKVGTDKTISTLRSDLVDPKYITWGGGTDFGNYLYVTDRREQANWSNGEITKIDLTGNKTPFCGGVYQPGAITIDTTGNYSDKMYVGNSANDKILSTDASGGTATTFSNYPYDASGGLFSISIDTTGNYNNTMFTGMYSSNTSVGGLFSIDTAGNESRYTDFERGGSIAFDDTVDENFGGAMFAAGRDNSDTYWTLYQVNGYYDTEIFGLFEVPHWERPDIEFGPDGAMYIMEYSSSTSDVIISRITPVPEPATLLLLGLGGLLIRKR